MLTNPQRPLNSSMPSLKVGTLPAAPMRSRTEGEGIARTGAPKNIASAPIKPGMKSQTRPDGVHSWLHGQAAPLQDESEPPLKTSERKIPLHPATTDKQRATVHPIANDPNEILTDAQHLGRRPRPAEKA